MKKIKITAIRKVEYNDLMAKYENPIEHTCDVCEGQSWISSDGNCPEGLCTEAWKSMKEFVQALARGEGNFYDGWMKNPHSAMISCNDGFRPVSFYIEAIADQDDTEGHKQVVCQHNPGIACPCPKECPRHGKCCSCVAHHREHGKLPSCLRDLSR